MKFQGPSSHSTGSASSGAHGQGSHMEESMTTSTFGLILTLLTAVSSFFVFLVQKSWSTTRTWVMNYIREKKSRIINSIKDRVYAFFNWERSSAHNLKKNPNANQYDISTCSICLSSPISLPVMSTCNHPFCAGCIMQCWETKQRKTLLNCPCCRREMKLLYRDFEDEDINNNSENDIVVGLKSYNAKFSQHKRTVIEMIKDTPFLLNVLLKKIVSIRNFWFLFKSVMSSRGIFGSILYILSPIDLLPEAILGPIGLIDDAAVLGVAFVLISNISYQLLQSIDQRR